MTTTSQPALWRSQPARMALVAITLAACQDPLFPDQQRAFERPSAIAFSCYDSSAGPKPMSWCTSGENAASASLYGFVLQPAEGSVIMVTRPAEDISAGNSSNPTAIPGSARPLDADPLSPGINAIPVGVRPVGIATDPSGCHVMTANAGTCDLSALAVESAADSQQRPRLDRIPITNAAGDAIGARPFALVSDPRPMADQAACPAGPQGVVYVAYPDCHMVAAVDAATGTVVAGVVFGEDGTATITDGDVGCAATCGSITDPTRGAPRPVAIAIGSDSRLYIGADNSPRFTIVDLDGDYLPAAVAGGVTFEGDIGIRTLAVSDFIEGGAARDRRFVYAAATDSTVRVASVLDEQVECDTQVDTRYLHGESSVSRLACLPVGAAETPPRRVDARSPGIQFPSSAQPLAVAFSAIDTVIPTNEQGVEVFNQCSDQDRNTQGMHGIFALVTLSTAKLAIVNVVDECNSIATGSQVPDVALAMAHQIRDAGFERGELWNACDPPVPQGSNIPIERRYQPHIEGANVARNVASRVDRASSQHLLPTIRQEACMVDPDGPDGEDEVNIELTSELAAITSAQDRWRVFPDFLSVPVRESWSILWEGALSRDSNTNAIDGPSRRAGFMEGQDQLIDRSGPFCRMGVEPFDIVDLSGCDPGLGDAGCRLGEVCIVDPEAPETIITGICVLEERADELAESCRDFMTSRRRYSVQDVHGDRLVLSERRRVLESAPLAGCVEAAECTDYYLRELTVIEGQEAPSEGELLPTWACEADPSRAPGPSRCVMTCDSASDCEAGWSCSEGRCVEAVLPPAECVAGIQQGYRVHAGEAFAVIGSHSGFLHDIIEDPVTGACMVDPAAHPLALGRLPLDAPDCTGDGITDVTPNPCKTVVQHAEHRLWSLDTTGVCSRQTAPELVERETAAIRFRNPVFTFHLVNPVVEPVITDTAACLTDTPGTEEPFPTVYPNMQIAFTVAGGYLPLVTALPTIPLGVPRRFMVYPGAIAADPLDTIWIIDQGDRASSIRGQVVYFDPDSRHSGNGTAYFSLSTRNYLE